jgi:hypothetical protein
MKRNLIAAAAILIVFGQAALAQTPAGAWAGWARCQIDVQGPGYTEHETHTWMIAGGAPTLEGAFRVYPGTWSVVGGGGLQRTQGTQTLTAQWAVNVPATSAPIALFVRASDGRLLIQARHAQLRSAGAVAGYQQLTIDGKPQPPGQISAEAFEWAFPAIDGVSTSTSFTGSSAPGVNGSVGFMQPAGSRGTATCTWQFGQGTAAPAPPPTLAAQAVPMPGGPSSGGAAPVTNSQASTAPTTTSSIARPVGTATRIALTGATGAVSGAETKTTADASVTRAGDAGPGTASTTTITPTAAPLAAAIPIQTLSGGSTQPSSGMRAFTESGTFTVPSGVTRLTVEVWGAGGGGAPGRGASCPLPNQCFAGAGCNGGGSGAYGGPRNVTNGAPGVGGGGAAAVTGSVIPKGSSGGAGGNGTGSSCWLDFFGRFRCPDTAIPGAPGTPGLGGSALISW